MTMGVFVDITGRSQGNIVVVKSLAETNSSGSRMWSCLCNCGKHFKVSTSALNAGVMSCGCVGRNALVKRNTGKPSNNLKPHGQSNSRLVYNVYRSNAKRRGINFNINYEQFVLLSSKCCHYCGEPPKQILRARYAKCNGVYMYNGLDRLNNDIGYVFENLVPCCKICNRAKYNMTEQDFIIWIFKACKHLHQ